MKGLVNAEDYEAIYITGYNAALNEAVELAKKTPMKFIPADGTADTKEEREKMAKNGKENIIQLLEQLTEHLRKGTE